MIMVLKWFVGIWPRFKRFWFSDWFDPKHSFLSLPAFWGPFLFITLIALAAFLKVTVDDSLKFDITGDLMEWYKSFQVPIWTFALLIPVIGLFNANHKSEQAKESMRITGEQNRFSNYYKHIEEFKKFVAAKEAILEDGKKIIKVVSHPLYSCLFPNAREKGIDFSISIKAQYFELIFEVSELIFVLATCKTSEKAIELESFINEKKEKLKKIVNYYIEIEDLYSFTKKKTDFGFEKKYTNLGGSFRQFFVECSFYGEIFSFEYGFDRERSAHFFIKDLLELIEHAPSISIDEKNNVEIKKTHKNGATYVIERLKHSKELFIAEIYKIKASA